MTGGREDEWPQGDLSKEILIYFYYSDDENFNQ